MGASMRRIAYRFRPRAGSRNPGVVWLGGFRSDMDSTKALALDAFCASDGRPCLRFDYSGHGVSGGDFEAGTIGRWLEESLAAIRAASVGPYVFVGSSMGGWIALLAALARPSRVAGLVGVAAAPDFTERLMWQAMAPAERDALRRDGYIDIPSAYGAPTRITHALVAEGRRHLLLDARIALACPVRLLHGQRDPDVPWEMSLRLAERLESDDVQLTLIKDGDHRLSRPQDLDLLCRTVRLLGGEHRA